MIHWRNVTAVVAALVLLPLAAAAAAPAGKVVIAQGVDPTTLDIMNQQEAPASIIAAHIFETLWERDPSLKIVPGLATEMPHLVATTPSAWRRCRTARSTWRSTSRLTSPTRSPIIRSCS